MRAIPKSVLEAKIRDLDESEIEHGASVSLPGEALRLRTRAFAVRATSHPPIR